VRIIIELFERPTADGGWAGDGGYVAVATREGQLVANGGPGAGGSERAAAQEAINSLFKREQEREEADHQPLVTPAPEFQPAVSEAPRGDFGSGTFTGYFAILTALESYLENKATGERPPVFIDYEDANGHVTQNRHIIPTRLDNSQTGGRPFRTGSAKLTAIDVEKDEPRHFIVDRIEVLVIA
jgi:hypothetical protein